MCLNLTEELKKQITSEDIVCYKRVLIDYNPDIISYQGKSFTGIINDIKCEGIIQIENNKAFFCTNNPELNGCSCKDKLGYLHSWRFDSRVQSIIVDGIDVIIDSNFTQFLTPYQGAKVKLGETYTSGLIHEFWGYCYKINIGLHSFATYAAARNDGGGVIVKCIIPAGSEYYLGEFNNKKSYASNQLKYLEVVTK